MKTYSRVAVILAALLSMAIGPGSARAQPDPPSYFVYQYVYYSDASLQTQVGYGAGTCGPGQEQIAWVSGQYTSYWTREVYGLCDGYGHLVYV